MVRFCWILQLLENTGLDIYIRKFNGLGTEGYASLDCPLDDLLWRGLLGN
jgi:hypothetical protein